jgi:MYXO-CTERM domain-containing protein
MNKTFIAVMAGSVPLFAVQSSQAAFVGIEVVSSDSFFAAHPNAAVAAAWNAGPNNTLDIYRVYANFNSNTAADRVNAVSGNVATPFTMGAVGGTIFNVVDEYHYNLASGNTPAHNAWDTYVTINSLPSSNGVSLSPGFDVETGNLSASESPVFSSNCAWFITPDNTAGRAVASAPGQANAPVGTFRVLLAQITVTQGTPNIFATALLNVNGVDIPINLSLTPPAPGALALLGIAGLVGRRRRTA